MIWGKGLAENRHMGGGILSCSKNRHIFERFLVKQYPRSPRPLRLGMKLKWC